MSNIKLQVGKTYRNRKGEEVKIIKNENGGEYIYKGSNSQWYTESGRFNCQSQESPYDLIEEVPSEPTRHTFDIPDGVKKVTVEQVGNRIVVEMMPEERKEPKPGDVMVNKYGDVYILKKALNSLNYDHSDYAWLGKDGRLIIGGMFCHPGRPATPEEAKLLFDALKKAGKRWNPQTMQIEDIKPKPGDVMINEYDSVYIFKGAIDDHSHECYAWLGKNKKVENLLIGGWDFSGRHATPEEAQPLWDALKKAGKRWNSKTMQVEDIGPKPGDIMINKFGSVYIFKNVYYDGWHNNFVWVNNNGRAFYNNTSACFPGRLATLEEAKLLFDALKKEGKQWNPETMQVEKITEIDRIREWVEEHLSSCYYDHERIVEIIEAYLKHRKGAK